MRPFRHLMLAALIACAAPAAFAQQTLEQRMTVEEFRAAGLDKLSAEELTSLNRWLQGREQQQASAAVEQAREEGREQARMETEAAAVGRSGGARETIESNIAGEFTGFGQGHRYTLENGQVWEQVDASRLAGVRLSSPAVTITPGAFGSWSLRINGYNTRARVKRVN